MERVLIYALSVNAVAAAGSGLVASFALIVILAGIGLTIYEIVAMWKVYEKAGRPGWASLIPIYNTWVLAEIGGKPGWWGLYPLLLCIPFVGIIPSLIISFFIVVGVAKNFGQSTTFGVVGLGIFSAVGFPWLAFGQATYAPSTDASVEPPFPSVEDV